MAAAVHNLLYMFSPHDVFLGSGDDLKCCVKIAETKLDHQPMM